MSEEQEAILIEPDPAAVFACAHSLWEACRNEASQNPAVDLSADYSGWDQLMREVMRIGVMFETWASENVLFDEFDEVWPYFMGDNFGKACFSVVSASHLDQFKERDCLRVALHLKLPLRLGNSLPIPIDLKADNPLGGSTFVAFRIQTVRSSLDGEDIVPFTHGDDPFDEVFSLPYFGIYGVNTDGLVEHICDRRTYGEALKLIRNLVPPVNFPDEPILNVRGREV